MRSELRAREPLSGYPPTVGEPSCIEVSRVGALAIETSGSLVRVVWTGTADASAIEALLECARANARRLGEGTLQQLLVIADGATGISRDGRRAIMKFGPENPWDRAAIVGVRYELKVVIELTQRVFSMMMMDTAELNFMDTEAEARAWLEA